MRNTHLRTAAAGATVAVGAWLSQGAIAFATPDGPRIALLPLSTGALAISLLAGALAAALARAGASLTPLWLLVFVLLPWLPFDVPAAFLMWSGPLTLLVWLAVARIMVWPVAGARVASVTPHAARAGMLAVLIFGFAAWRAAPSVPGGDEPHYLIITQSLLYDRDLKIENNHRRGDYQSYFQGQLRPDYLRRGRDGEIYSIHAPGISALVAPAFALGGYPATVVFLVLIGAAGSALLWHATWLATRHTGASWFGWAAVTLSATAIFHTFTVYPDGVGGLLTLTGILALLRADEERRQGSTRVMPWWWHGAALALLPWLHTRFALLAGSLGSLILVRLARAPNPAAKAAAFLVVPALSACAWIGYFVVIYGTLDPSAPYGSAALGALSNIPRGVGGLLFDQRFGLIANAPVLAFGFVGFAVMLGARWTGRPEAGADRGGASCADARRLALELLFVGVPYLLTVTNFTMWWGGWSAPARFAAPLLPILGISSAFAWIALQHRATKGVAVGALALTAFISAVLIIPDRGRLAFNTRVAPALWFEWVSPLSDLAQGLPDWFRQPHEAFVVDVAIWIGLLTAGWLVARRLSSQRALAPRAAFSAAGVALYLCLAMLALTIVWTRHDADGRTPAVAQMAYLRRLGREPRVSALQLAPPRALEASEVPSMMRIWGDAARQPMDGAGRDDRPLLALPPVPAGQYRIRPRTRAAGGWLMVGIGQDQFALRTEPLQMPAEPLLIEFPVDVCALIVRGDERARQIVRRIDIEPVSLRPVGATLTREVARQAVRYGTASVFFVDDRSYPEPESFWMGGSSAASVVVQPDDVVASVPLLLRNAPVSNHVIVTSGSWRAELRLAPGEVRRVEVPFEADEGAILIRFDVSSGFRPSEADPESRDERFLGVWVQVEL